MPRSRSIVKKKYSEYCRMERENGLKQLKPQLVNQFSGCASPEFWWCA
jgi:hypothetical protein